MKYIIMVILALLLVGCGDSCESLCQRSSDCIFDWSTKQRETCAKSCEKKKAIDDEDVFNYMECNRESVTCSKYKKCLDDR